MSPQCKQMEQLIQALQGCPDRTGEHAAGVVDCLRRICAGAANACPVDDLIGLSLYVLEMGKKAGRDQAEEN